MEETCDGFNRLWCNALADCQELRDENSDLRRKMAGMEQYEPHDQKLEQLIVARGKSRDFCLLAVLITETVAAGTKDDPLD